MSKYNNNQDSAFATGTSEILEEITHPVSELETVNNQMEIRDIVMILAGSLGSGLLRPTMSINKLVVENNKINLYTQSNKLIITLIPGNSTVEGMKVLMEVNI